MLLLPDQVENAGADLAEDLFVRDAEEVAQVGHAAGDGGLVVELVRRLLFDEGKLEELQQAGQALYVALVAFDLVGEDVEDFDDFGRVFDGLWRGKKNGDEKKMTDLVVVKFGYEKEVSADYI